MNKNIFNIDMDDEMFLYARGPRITEEQSRNIYLSIGYLIWQQIRLVLETFNKDVSSIESLLDFASGYGRVTRFIAEEISPGNITVSDIYPEAVDFQVKNFNVNGVVSSKNPADLKLEGNYSAITCVSLFSHLPKDLFVVWLDYLVSLLKDDGLLIFTTHPLGVLGKFGMKFFYRRISESRTLKADIYGTSYVSRAFVEGLVKKRYPGKKLLCYAPKYLGVQDLYVIGDASQEYRDVTWPGLIEATIDSVTKSGNYLTISGWAYSKLSREPAIDITAYSATAECKTQSTLGITRNDVARHFGDEAAAKTGFNLVVELPDDTSPDIRLEFRGQSGMKGVHFLQTRGLEDSTIPKTA